MNELEALRGVYNAGLRLMRNVNTDDGYPIYYGDFYQSLASAKPLINTSDNLDFFSMSQFWEEAAKRFNDFNNVWKICSANGHCDEIGGAEWKRISDEFMESNKMIGDIQKFIVVKANQGLNS